MAASAQTKTKTIRLETSATMPMAFPAIVVGAAAHAGASHRGAKHDGRLWLPHAPGMLAFFETSDQDLRHA